MGQATRFTGFSWGYVNGYFRLTSSWRKHNNLRCHPRSHQASQIDLPLTLRGSPDRSAPCPLVSAGKTAIDNHQKFRIKHSVFPDPYPIATFIILSSTTLEGSRKINSFVMHEMNVRESPYPICHVNIQRFKSLEQRSLHLVCSPV